MARKLTLTKSRIEEAGPLVKAGLRHNAIAAKLGVSPQLLSIWLKTGVQDLEAGKASLHADLVTTWRLAEAEGQEELLKLHRSAMASPRAMDSKAVRWELERRFTEFRPGAASQESNFEVLSPEECEERVLERLQAFVAAYLTAKEKAASEALQGPAEASQDVPAVEPE